MVNLEEGGQGERSCHASVLSGIRVQQHIIASTSAAKLMLSTVGDVADSALLLTN
jgi:hypothetical protein